ncbi:PAS domain-containing protein [Luteibacter rhizovicinus]|uniref:PAS domain-containing protein n=1 Tax=Luteibacter rhizovicinus TaxID=242606 RepID=UPI00062D3C6B|nr:PAS domain-containing protein [Luteibacter rhizovicinus]
MALRDESEVLLNRARDICRVQEARCADAIVVADIDGRIVFANARANVLLGCVRIGSGVEDYSCMHGLFTEDGRPYPSSDLPLSRAILRGETVFDVRLEVRRYDGTVSLLSVDAEPLYGAGGKQIGGVAMFDVTRLSGEPGSTI